MKSKIIFAILPPFIFLFLYGIFLLLFAFCYMWVYQNSLSDIRTSLIKSAKATSWKISIGLFTQLEGRNYDIQDDLLTYKSSLKVWPSDKRLALSFSSPEKFINIDDELMHRIDVIGYLSYDPTTGPAKSMSTGPYYKIYSIHHFRPQVVSVDNTPPPYSYTDDPLAYTRFPVGLAPSGVFGKYQFPYEYKVTPVGKLSASAPRDIFLEKCSDHIYTRLELIINDELKKWKSMGRIGTSLYFAATFGLGEISPGSSIVRYLLILQILLGTVALSIIVPGIVRFIKNKQLRVHD